ncbi:SUMF1/EgtB/PvdO family nonheme iron enzyme [Neolewinella antarctica]|uniref:Formylglycine-generating enzyme required for sulfatase activity n=1 Tax=Neolewinella antarctica TaxID=442734 RepID=A0ABX0X8U5_9BACT|nr:SUMF1/EgtB/PvdO family nonheme iron enzyme [Neolewinella antarctica]NJC25681.1 formylglycine-generating enzyme required for sulfatase activity [Neolewinella antarctica]
MKIFCTCLLLLLLAPTYVAANNIRVSNVELVSQANGIATFEYDLAWDNSWRLSDGPANWDAAYVFFVVSINDGPFEKIFDYEVTYPTGFVAIDTIGDAPNLFGPKRFGHMVHRAADGGGTANMTDVVMEWNYEAGGYDGNSSIDLRVFATEMVYVPEGPFTVGNGTEPAFEASFATYSGTTEDTFFSSTRINSNDPIRLFPTGFLQFGLGFAEGFGGDRTERTYGEDFPKGFTPFYCMKYEVSQQQWVDFFNTLNPAQQDALDVTGPLGKNTNAEQSRNGVSWLPGSAATTTLPDVPMNYIPNDFYSTYLQWAGLRPLTELEYEKAARGPITPIGGEYAWGNPTIAVTSYILQSAGTPAEQISNPSSSFGNASYGQTSGNPLRNGIFAASAPTPSRTVSGGSYYGIMELSGNLYERAISLGNPSTSTYAGFHGRGELDVDGTLSPYFPITDGLAFRGGSFQSFPAELRFASRRFGTFAGTPSLQSNGIRGVISTGQQ